MELKVFTQISGEVELMMLLSRIYSNNQSKEAEIRESYPSDPEWAVAQHDFELNLTQRLLDLELNKDPHFELLFAPFHSNMAYCLGMMTQFEPDDLSPYESLLDLSFDSFAAVKLAIVDSALEDHLKYRLLLIINDRDLVTGYYTNFMTQLSGFIAEIEAQEALCAQRFLEESQADDFQDCLKECGVSFVGVDRVLIEPNIVSGKMLTMDLENKGSERILKISMGILIYRFYQFKGKSDQSEASFLKSIKILSDQTKIDILKFCASQERYGSEIAKQLNISGATVSHHMSALSSNHYVTLRMDKNRVYYLSDVDAILADLELGKRVFTR